MVAIGTPLHTAAGLDLPLATDRALVTLGVGFVAFLAVGYLWYRDYRHWRGGEDV